MTPEAVIRSIEVVTQIPDSQIHEIIVANGGNAGLVNKMLARKADMADRLDALRRKWG